VNIDTCKFLIWGYKNVYHTHSHIHEGFYRALKLTGKDAQWLDAADNIDGIDFSNTFIITNHDCVNSSYWPWAKEIKSKLPIREDCFYAVHGLNDHSEIRDIFSKFNNALSWNVYNDFSYKLGLTVGLPLTERIDLDVDSPFYPMQKHLEFRWATDLLPFEIEKNKPTEMLSLKNRIINWVGTIWHVNQKELNLFSKACSEDGVKFIQVGSKSDNHVSIEENIRLIRESYMAPAISGSHHLTEGYAPCRIFKNISYGQFGITNNKRVNEIFGEKLIYNPNPYKLYFEAKEKLQTIKITKMKDNPIQLEYLKFVLLSQLTLEANENLYFTQQYRQQIKNLGKRLNNELESVVRDEYEKIYNTDREMTTNILRSMEELVQKIAKSTIDDMVLLNAIIDKYKENKDWFLEHANAEFLKLDI
jgi:hypothetical protein